VPEPYRFRGSFLEKEPTGIAAKTAPELEQRF